MYDDYMQRGYLLPEGCKNLTDLYGKDWMTGPWSTFQLTAFSGGKTPAPLPVIPPPAFPIINGEMVVPEKMTVQELARALSQKVFKIIGDLIRFDVFVKADAEIDFDTIAKVLALYGIVAKRAT